MTSTHKPRLTRKILPTTINLRINNIPPFHINTIATLLRLRAKIKIPNKLNHLPHQLQGRQQ
ncbi:hypothetical protein WJF84_25655, partial [Salmonella enterica subsp. enterica serovar Corvallis]